MKKNDCAVEFPSLSRKELQILGLLVSGGRELYGLEMVEESNGELKRGTIYVTLHRMQEKGYIDSRQEARTDPEIGIPRRLYRVTGYGEKVFRAYEAAHGVMSAGLIPAEG
jgi:PadR family transcriptional regulator PadR